MDADRRVRVGAGIDDHTLRLGSRVMDEPDNAAFEITLMEHHIQVRCLGQRPAVALYIGHRVLVRHPGPVCAEQIEIGSIDDVDQTAHGGSLGFLWLLLCQA